MKRFLLSMASLALVLGSACSDDDPKEEGNIPTIDVGAVAYSEQESVAKFEVSPSTDTETWYWKCTPTSETGTWNSVTGNQPTTLDLDVELDKDYEFEAYAENAYGKSEVKTVPFRINSSELPGDMVTITVKHLTAFSVDVDIEKSVKCSRYVVAAMPKSAYNELYFISSAETSLNPNKDYPLQPYNWSDRSATFTEYTLSKNKMQDDPESEGVRLTADDQDGMNEMIVAVYAEPAGDGQAEVFTQEFTVPKPSNYNGSIEVDIDVKDDDITLSTFAATVAAGDACKKIFTSLIQLGGDYDTPFDEIDDTAKQQELLTVLGNNRQVLPYTGPFRVEYEENMKPGETRRLYVVPIAEDGTIGKVTYRDITCKTPEFEGEGTINSVEFSQTEPEHLLIDLELNAQAEKVRIFCWSEGEASKIFHPEPGQPRTMREMEWLMYDRENNERWTEEFSRAEVAAGAVSLPIVHPGEYYVVYGATVDAQGGVSYPVNLAQLLKQSDDEEETYGTIPEEKEEKPEVSFDGTGEATFHVTETDKTEDMLNAECSVTKGANTVKAYCFRTSDTATEGNFEQEVKEAFADYPASITGSYKELTFADGDTETVKMEYLIPYDNMWGGHIIVVVTVDQDGKLKIADYYKAGTGDK